MKKIALFAFIISGLAYAQEINLGESVIISTTGFEEPLLSENKNVTVISKDDIEKKEYKDLEAVLKEAPNVIVRDTYFGPVIDLRGNGERAISRVKVLVDGIAINPLDESMGTLPLNTVPVNSVERIEVIPGGGAVLNGSGTAGGVVNIITKSTARKNFFNAEYGNLSYNTNKVSFNGGYNLTEDLYFNLGYTYLDGKGYRDGDSNWSGTLNGGVDYKLTERQRIRLQGSKFKGGQDTSTAVLKSLLEENRKAAGFPVVSESDREAYSLDHEFKVTDKFTVLTTLYTQNFQRNFTENSIMDYEMERTGSMPFPVIGRDLPAQMLGTFDEKTNGLKLRGKYEYEKGDVVFGYDYAKTKLKRNSFITTEGNFSPNSGNPFIDSVSMPAKVNIDIMNDIYKTTNGIYILNRYNLTDSLQLTTGARYENAEYGGKRTSHTRVNMNGKDIVDSQKEIDTKDESNNFAGEIGLNYFYNDTGSLYTRYERGFISPLPGQITDKVDGVYLPNDVKSETSDTFEIGIRDFIGNTYLTWSVFTTFTNDEITLEQANSHNPAIKEWKYYNLDKTRRIGTELLAEQQFGKLKLTEGLTYVNTKITSGQYKGEKVPLVPEGKLTLGADYAFTKRLAAGILYTYVGKSSIREFDTEDNSYKTNLSGYNFTDISVTYKATENFTVKAGINNVFNNQYNYEETRDTAIPAPERNYYIAGSISL